jgi:phosphatidate cytidylyltransferase
MLGQRIATAIVLLAILLPAIFLFPPVAWGGVSLMFLSAAAWEWMRLIGRVDVRWPAAIALGLAGLAVLAWRMHHAWPREGMVVAMGGLTLFWLVAAPMRLRCHATGHGWPLALTLLGGCWLAMLELRERGVVVLVASMALVWMADIAAYFVGKAVGRRKLAPSISPGKSWEGAVGGAATVAIVGLALAGLPVLSDSLPAILVDRLSALLAALTLAALALLSIVGDLYESLLKRQAGFKDSSALLPGHGGVLDRIDALLPVMPAALLLHLLLA